MEPLKVGEHTVEVVWVLSERAPLVPCRSASAACRDTRFHGDSGTVRLAGRFSDHAIGRAEVLSGVTPRGRPAA